MTPMVAVSPPAAPEVQVDDAQYGKILNYDLAGVQPGDTIERQTRVSLTIRRLCDSGY